MKKAKPTEYIVIRRAADPELFEAIAELAKTEDRRSPRNMAAILIKEALEARKLKSSKGE